MIDGFASLGTITGLLGTVLAKFSRDEDVTDIGSYSRAEQDLIVAKGSMVKFLQTFIIEPTVYITENAIEEEIVEKVVEASVNIFAAYYNQVFQILTNVYGVDAMMAFNVLKSNTNIDSTVTTTYNLMDATTQEVTVDQPLAMLTTEAGQAFNYKDKAISNILDNAFSKYINLTINLKDNEGRLQKGVVIPILIKANIKEIKTNSILDVIDSRNKANFFSRIDDYRSGAISLYNLIMADDLIADYKRKRLNDSNEFIASIRAKDRDAIAKLATNRTLGLDQYYNILVITDREKAIIESELRGKLINAKYREKLHTATHSLQLAIINPHRERVTLYVKDAPNSVVVRNSRLSKSSGGNDNMAEIVKALANNNSFTL